MMGEDNNEQLWPAADYYQQVTKLQQAIGEEVFLVELRDTAINAGVKYSDQPFLLLDVIPFPQPDPYRRLCPHMLILNDGRGINLGRVIRISRGKAFGPDHDDVLFSDADFIDNVLLAPRVLSRESISATSKGILGQIFGEEPGRLLQGSQNNETTPFLKARHSLSCTQSSKKPRKKHKTKPTCKSYQKFHYH